MATLTLHAYCGMPVPVAEGDADDLRVEAARFLRRKRRRKPVATLVPGRRWEIMTPDDAFMVADDEGVLVLDPVGPTWRCRECGDDVPKGEACGCMEDVDDGWNPNDEDL